MHLKQNGFSQKMSIVQQDAPFNLALSLLNLARERLEVGQHLFVDEERQLTLKEFECCVAMFHQSVPLDGAGTPVIIHMSDSVQLAIVFYGLLLKGNLPVVINPRTRPETLSYILADSKAQAIISDSLTEDRLAELPQIATQSLTCILSRNSGLYTHEEQLCEFNSATDAADNSLFELAKSGHPNDVCLWQYTSGTTGDPKAVMHTSKSVLAICKIFAHDHLGIRSGDVVHSIPKTFFGYGMGNSLFFPVYCGATSVLIPDWPSCDIIYKTMSRFKPTVVFGGPAIYQLLLNDPRTDSWVENTRVLFSAGASLSKSLFQQWQKKYERAIVDGIGATELLHVFIANDINEPVPGFTGTALPGFEIKLVKKDGSSCVPGELGSMLVKGPTVAEGYWNQPGKQTDKFCEGWYRTGDIFSLETDDLYCYKGREDDLFKVNGRWVDPYQIEGWIMQNYSAVNEAILVPVSHAENTRSALYLTFKQQPKDKQIFLEQLSAHMDQYLESYKRPLRTIILEEMPRNDNGKVVRKSLTLMYTAESKRVSFEY